MAEMLADATPSLSLLGPPLLEDGRGPRRFDRRKSLALLAYLALEARVHARDSLCALLWPECEQGKARANLRSSLFELSHVLGDASFEAVQDRLRLRPEALRVDVADLVEVSAACEAGSDDMFPPQGPSARERLEAAARSWRGGFMAGFSLADCADFDDWQFRWAGRARKVYCAALRRLAGWELGQGRLIAAEELAARWIEAEPLNEEARRLQIRVLLDMGQADGARRSYERWEKTSCEELGREPGRETRELVERAPRGAKGGAALPFEGEAAAPALLGRTCLLAELGVLLEKGRGRLLSLTGPGGVGKTAIARALLAALRPRFPGGAWFLDLSTEREASRLPFRLAAALGMRDSAGTPEAMTELVAERLRSGRSLIVLDNLEQLAGAAAAVAPLLAAAGGAGMAAGDAGSGGAAGPSILATSRRALGLEGELVRSIEPLPFPGEGTELDALSAEAWPALELLLLRSGAGARLPSLDAATLRTCARICARLDGLPLALELAAPLLSFLGPRELLARLERHHALDPDRTESRPDRQRSLDAVVEWSRELLRPAESSLFSGLAILEGSFDAGSAEALVADGTAAVGEEPSGETVVELLESLVAASLLNRRTEQGSARFSYYATIRDVALAGGAGTAEAGKLRDRAAAHFLARAEAAAAGLRGPEQLAVLHALGQDGANHEASVIRFLETGRRAEALRLCRALAWSWFRSGRHATGVRLLEAALSRPGAGEEAPPAFLRGACLRALAWLRFTLGDWHEAHGRYLEALPLLEAAGEPEELLRCLADLGVVERWLGNRSGGEFRSARALELAERLGDRELKAMALIWHHGTRGGKPGTAEQEAGLQEAVRLARLAGDPWLLAHARQSLGEVLRERGCRQEAVPHFERALEGFRALEDGWMAAWTLEGYGMNDCGEGDFRAADARLREALGLFLGVGARGDAAYVLGELGLVAARAGRTEEADLFLGAFSSLRGELGLETLAMSCEPPSLSEVRPSLREALAESRGRDGPAWRRGLRLGYAELRSLLGS